MFILQTIDDTFETKVSQMPDRQWLNLFIIKITKNEFQQERNALKCLRIKT